MHRLQELTSVLERLALAASFDAASDLLLGWVRAYTGCRSALLRMVIDNEGGGWLGGCASSGTSESFLRDEILVPLSDCICGRVTSGDTNPELPFFTQAGSFVWGRMSSLQRDFPADQLGTLRGRCVAERYESVAVFPIKAAGKVVGSLHLADTRPDFFAYTAELMEAVCRLAGDILIRHKTGERDRLLLDKVQSALLPTLPRHLEGLSIGVSYDSAGEMSRLGGDFYDILDLGRSGILVLVGDVCGKGLEAAGTATRTRYTLCARATEGINASDFMHTANEALLRLLPPWSFVTAVACLIKPWAHVAEVCLAGHPAPLHFDNNTCAEIGAPHNPPLGVFADAQYKESVETFTRGDVLVVYTDGVSDARRSSKTFGVEGIASVLSDVFYEEPEYIAQGVCSAATQYHDADLPTDDRLVMAVRFT
jgi:serine phosphatase RsbU (regulator of sigma subunit)